MLFGPIRQTVDEWPSLDIRRLSRENLLAPGRWSEWAWTDFPGLIRRAQFIVDGGCFALHYTLQPGPQQQKVSERIKLVETDCWIGGSRPWFVCPGPECGRRVAVLYLVGDHFRCRHCQSLVYESQYQTELTRMIMRAKRIRVHLGGTGNLTDPFPVRPKGMHRKTYQRWAELGAEAEAEANEMISERVERLTAVFNRRRLPPVRKGRENGAKAGTGTVPRARHTTRAPVED
jgi:hypothetical protein